MKISSRYCNRCGKEIKIVYRKPDEDSGWHYDILKCNLESLEDNLYGYDYAVRKGYITELELCDDCKKSFTKWLSNEEEEHERI